MYLVRDGVVNDYALGYVMTIPYHIHYLDFKWQATTPKRPVRNEGKKGGSVSLSLYIFSI